MAMLQSLQSWGLQPLAFVTALPYVSHDTIATVSNDSRHLSAFRYAVLIV